MLIKLDVSLQRPVDCVENVNSDNLAECLFVVKTRQN